MRIDFNWAPSPLLAVLVMACSGLADPQDRAPGDSMFELEPGGGGQRPNQMPPPPPSGQSCVVAGQTYLNRSIVPSGDSCNGCTCYDGGVICSALVCEPVVCAQVVEDFNGVCSRFPLDPCISQDPDCGESPSDSCEAAGQSFPHGSEVPSGDACNRCTCDDGTVSCTEIACEPVVCSEVVEDSDGVCSRFPLDPCISQDPDCGASSGGSCEAAGQSFPDGSEIPSGDSCNGCGCYAGTVICTEMACEPVFSPSSSRRPTASARASPSTPASPRIPTVALAPAAVRSPDSASPMAPRSLRVIAATAAPAATAMSCAPTPPASPSSAPSSSKRSTASVPASPSTPASSKTPTASPRCRTYRAPGIPTWSLDDNPTAAGAVWHEVRSVGVEKTARLGPGRARMYAMAPARIAPHCARNATVLSIGA